jgi:hypothetical protein
MPLEFALIASLADVGPKLARNDAARELVADIMAECDRRKLGDYPTVMMLRVALDLHNIPITFVPFAELGIKGDIVPLRGGGSA